MNLRVLVMTLFAVGTLIACGSGEEAVPADVAHGQELPENVVSEPVEEAVSTGGFTFEVHGEAKRFDYLPAGDNFYTSVSSAIKARSSAGSKEALGIIFLSLDLKKVTYPADLPAPRNSGKPGDPMTAMASIGFSFIDESGEEWAGPGKVRVESFGADGMIVCTFTDVSLPHTDKERANVVLTGGHAEARICSPW